jgi:hypothetical protein
LGQRVERGVRAVLSADEPLGVRRAADRSDVFRLWPRLDAWLAPRSI